MTTESDESEVEDGNDDIANTWENTFTELPIANCGRNLVNAQTILTLWKIKSQDYTKTNEIFVFTNFKHLKFCPSGSHLILYNLEAFNIYDKHLSLVASVDPIEVYDEEQN